MPTRRPRRRHTPMSALTSVDLPLPGGPVMPTTCAPWPAAKSEGSSVRSAGSPRSMRVSSRASGRRPATSRLTSAGGRARGSSARSRRCSCRGRRLGHAGCLQARDVGVGNDPAGGDEHVVHAALAEQRHRPRQERHVRARQDREPDDVDVLLLGGVGDHLRCLPQAGVDDLEPLVAEAASEDLRAAVVPVETRLGDEDADRRVGHAGPILASRSISAASAMSRAVTAAAARVRSVKVTRR